MRSILIKLSRLFSIRMAAVGLTFIQTIVITQVFGSDIFGLLSLALSVSALLVLILSVGLDQVLMKDIASIGPLRVSSSKKWKHTWSLVRALVVPVTLGVSISGIIIVQISDIAGPYKETITAALVLLPVALIRKFLEAMCQGVKNVVRSIIGSQIVYPILMILGALYIWFLGIERNSLAISIVYSVALVGSMLASVLIVSAAIKELFNSNKLSELAENDNRDITESPGHLAIYKSGLNFSLVSLGLVLGQHIDVLLMGVFSSPQEVGLVRIAARIGEMAGLFRAIIVLQYKPMLAEAYGQSNLKQLREHSLFMLKVFTLTGVPITLFCWIFTDYILMVFGPEFVEAVWATRIYVTGVLVTLVMGPAGAILVMTGMESEAAKSLFLALAIQIILDLIFIPFLGVNGCALANFTSLFVLSFRNWYLVRKKYYFDVSIFTFLKV